MTIKQAIAALIGAVAMFVWTTIAHVATPLATVGVSQMSTGESAALTGLKAATGDKPGLYLFPAIGDPSKADMAAYQARLRSSPSGMLIYHPPGARALEPRMMIAEFLFELLEAIALVWILARQSDTGLAGRAAAATAVGLIAAVATNGSYWVWYGFPASYTAATAFVEAMKFIVAGVTATLFLNMRARISPAGAGA